MIVHESFGVVRTLSAVHDDIEQRSRKRREGIPILDFFFLWKNDYRMFLYLIESYLSSWGSAACPSHKLWRKHPSLHPVPFRV